MKLRRIRIENVLSFLDPAELLLDGDISIIIGPNGGGKTNILDTVITILRRHLLKSWLPYKSPVPENPDRYEFRANNTFNYNYLIKHYQGKEKNQLIEIDLEVTTRDIDNISQMRDSSQELLDLIDRSYIGLTYPSTVSWDPSLLRAGQQFTYQIVNDALQTPQEPNAQLYLSYLSNYEADNHLRSRLGKIALSMPMVSMPVNRAGGGFQASLSLANHNESDYKQSVDGATSRTGSSIVTLAIGRIAIQYRLLLEKDSGEAKSKFYADPQIKSLTSILESLGYKWELICTEPLSNQYDVQLNKQGAKFFVDAASSGEKELLTYLFAIYALNVRDALIVIDEPELHLHPRWQNTLLGLFERLTNETGNQFLLATHSPVFVSPSSIQYVSRVYSKGQKSAIVRLNNRELPQTKHLFSIVNSQNNERMFFADKVVLVEGISDRLFFDAVFRKLGIYEGTIKTIEIIEVGGKNLFAAYEKLLIACQVPYAIIADLDYVNEIGTPVIKTFFRIHEKKIKDNAILNAASKDGESLVARMEEAISSSNLNDLKELWEYIKGRQRRLRKDLNEYEKKALDAFIDEKRMQNIFILSKGDLETYLPNGYKGKDIEKLIKLLDGDFWSSLTEEAQTEVTLITTSIKNIGNEEVEKPR